MIYATPLEFRLGSRAVLVVPSRSGFSVRCSGYKSLKYETKFHSEDFSKKSYTLCSGSMSFCASAFFDEVNYLWRFVDELF